MDNLSHCQANEYTPDMDAMPDKDPTWSIKFSHMALILLTTKLNITCFHDS
jgi:hypothetical protein